MQKSVPKNGWWYILFVFLVFSLVNALANPPIQEPQVGQTQLFHKYDEGFFVGYSTVSATCQAIGDHIIVFTADAQVQGIYPSIENGQLVLYAATSTGIYVSTDTAKTWSYFSGVYGVENTDPKGELFVWRTTDRHDYVAGTYVGLYWSRNGSSWRLASRGLVKNVPYYKLVVDTTLGTGKKEARKFIASQAGLYYIRDIIARTWKDLNKGMPLVPPHPAPVYDMTLIPDSLLFLATEFGPYKGWISENEKEFSWEPLIKLPVTFQLQSDSTTFKQFVLTQEYDNYSIGTNSFIYVKDNATGARWAGNPAEDEAGNLIFTISDDNLYFTGSFGHDYSTINVNDISIFISGGNKTTQIAHLSDGTLIYTEEKGVFRLHPDGTVESFGLDTIQVNKLYVDEAQGVVYAGTNVGLYKSSLSGANWQKLTPMLDDGYGVTQMDYDVRDIVPLPGGKLLLGCYLGGVLEYDGNNFTSRNIGLTYRKVDLADIARIVKAFDSSSAIDSTKGIYQRTTEYFGNIPDVDGIPDKVFVLITDLLDYYYLSAGNGIDYSFATFDSVDQKLKTEDINSNQRDILYLDNHPTDLSANTQEAEAALAHALAEMIVYNYDPDEEPWLVEGIAMWSRWINGYRFYSHSGMNAYVDLHNVKPKGRKDNLLRWGDYLNIKDEMVAAFSFFDYVFEHYLKDSSAVQSLIQDTLNAVPSLEKFFNGKSFEDVFSDWALALYLDPLGTDFMNGLYAFKNIDVSADQLPLDWGVISTPPYPFSIAGWSYYYLIAKGWDASTGKSGVKFLDSTFVFNGDDVGKFHIFMIEQKNFDLDTNIRVTPIQLDAYNHAVYNPEFKTSENDPDPYVQLAFLVVYTEPMTPDGGAFTVDLDVTPASRLSFYPLQNRTMQTYFDFYMFSNEKTYVDGGQAALIDEGLEGPQVTVTNGTDTLHYTLTGFLNNGNNLWLYHGFFNLDTLLQGAQGQLDFMVDGEDAAGNKFAFAVGPLTYQKIQAHKAFTIVDENKEFRLSSTTGFDRKTLLTVFKRDKEAVLYQEQSSLKPEQVSHSWVIGPVGYKVDATIEISYADLNVGKDVSQLGIYQKVKDEWQYIPSEVDPVHRVVRAKIQKLGEFRLQIGEPGSQIQDIPKTFALKQNYPNPFNPETVIEYQLPKDVHVTLTLYNILGQKVATLVDARKKAGYYRYHLNMEKLRNGRLASGVYFYSMKAGQFTDTKKLLYVK